MSVWSLWRWITLVCGRESESTLYLWTEGFYVVIPYTRWNVWETGRALVLSSLWLSLCCRFLRGWWTCWTGYRPGTAPLVAPATPSWRRWPRLVCVSSLDTFSSRTHRSVGSTAQNDRTEIRSSLLQTQTVWFKYWREIQNTFTSIGSLRLGLKKKYQAFYGCLCQRHCSHSSHWSPEREAPLTTCCCCCCWCSSPQCYNLTPFIFKLQIITGKFTPHIPTSINV